MAPGRFGGRETPHTVSESAGAACQHVYEPGPKLAGARATTNTIPPKKIPTMLYTIAIILLILWLLGLVSSTTVGGFVHVLLVLAVVVILIRLIQGRRPL